MLRENFFFIHQGETNRLAMATPIERIKMLEKFAGADEWEKEKEKVTQDLNECKKSIEEFDQKLEELDGDLANLSKGNYNEGRGGGHVVLIKLSLLVLSRRVYQVWCFKYSLFYRQ